MIGAYPRLNPAGAKRFTFVLPGGDVVTGPVHGAGGPVTTIARVPCKQVENVCARNGKPSAGMAIRVARLARVSVFDVLGGVWPPEGACPHCGRV